MIDIKKLQSGILKPYYRGTVDGDWGPLTQAAMNAYQASIGVAAPKWLGVAEKELGVTEIVGAKHNPRILEYHSFTDLGARNDETAWCSSFANFCMAKSGFPYARSAAARSWLQWGIALASPRYGCVTVLRRGTSEWEGHVAFCVAEDRDSLALLGGNQSNKVRISIYSRADLLGFRWCK